MNPRDYPHIRTALPGPRARPIIERDAAFTSTSYQKEYPLVIAGGQGAMVEDVDGNRFLDFMAGIAVATTGYNHPQVVQAIQAQAGRFLHICGTDFYFEGFADLAERLAQCAPGTSPKRSFLCNSGTEAVEAALKLARHHTRRPAFIAFEGAFHGRSYGALSLTSSKARQRAGFAPFLPEVHHLPYPDPYRQGGGEAALAHTMQALDDLVTRHVDAHDVAAIVVEPILGEGGYVVPPAGFLPALRKFCDTHGVLLIADEMQSGIGRTGKMWACDWDGVEPDIVAMAKGLGSGLPIGAMVARTSVMTWPEGSHGSTFGGNPLGCAAALATLDVVEPLLPHVQAMGERLLGHAQALRERHVAVGDVRGRGLMLGIEFVKSRRTREPDGELANRVIQRAFQRGLLLLGCGRSTVRIAPPLVLDAHDVDTGMRILDECIAAEAAPTAEH